MERRPYQLTVYGQASLRNGAGEAIRVPTRPVFVLLVVLATHENRKMFRHELADIVWPGQGPQTARDSLRNGLSALRKLLPQGSVVVSGDEVSLQPGTVEILDSESELHEFLPGHDHDWVVQERLARRESQVTDLCRKAQLHWARGEASEAQELADRALRVDPLSEEAARMRIRFLEEQGDTVRAAMVGDLHRRNTFSRLGAISEVRPVEPVRSEHPLFAAVEWLKDRNPREAMALLASTGSQWSCTDPGRSLQIHERVLAATDERSPDRNLVEAERLMLLWVSGGIMPHLSEVEEFSRRARAEGDAALVAKVSSVLTYGYLSTGMFDQSLREAKRLYSMAHDSGDPRLEARSRLTLSVVLLHTGNQELSRDFVRSQSENFGFESPLEQADLEMFLAGVYRREGKLNKALEHLERAKRTFQSSLASRSLAWAELETALILEAMGDYEQSDQKLGALQEKSAESSGHSFLAMVGESRARIASRRGEYMQAAELLSKVKLFRGSIGTVPSIFEREDLGGTRRFLKERLSTGDLRTAFHRAKMTL